MKKTQIIHIVLCCMAVLLFGCAASSSAPKETESGSKTEQAEAPTVSETPDPVSTIRKMKLSDMEAFYLSAFSNADGRQAVYEIQLADGDSYSSFTGTVYEFEDGSWVKSCWLYADIKSSISCFAVDYADLSLPSMAFKSGSSVRSSRIFSSDEQSPMPEGYASWDMDVEAGIDITDGEVPLIACRRSRGDEEKKADVRDFFSPEAIPADETEEYYMLTVQFAE